MGICHLMFIAKNVLKFYLHFYTGKQGYLLQKLQINFKVEVSFQDNETNTSLRKMSILFHVIKLKMK